MADARELALLSEIARKLRKLDCICEGVNSESSLVVEDYQPLDCNGDPVGSPLNVMPTIAVAKQDVNICNVDALAAAIDGGSSTPYNKPRFLKYTSTRCLNGDDSIDMSKLHSVSFSITGSAGNTVTMANTLGGASDTVTGLPVGFSDSFAATTIFGTGDLCFNTFTGDATVILTLMLSA